MFALSSHTRIALYAVKRSHLGNSLEHDMDVNPHKSGPTEKKLRPFDISLFMDVYKVYEEEFSKEFMGKHVGMAAIMIDDQSQGKLECCGTLLNMQYLVTLLVMRLATVHVSAVYEASKGKEILGIKDSAEHILENVWKNLAALKNFDHQFPKEKQEQKSSVRSSVSQ